MELITLQNSNATIHPTKAKVGEKLPEGYSRSYGGFLLRQASRTVQVDQRLVRKEMDYLSRHVLIAFFVGGRPPSQSIPQWLESVQRQVGGHVSMGRNLGRGFFQIRTRDAGTAQKLSLLLKLDGVIVSCKVGSQISTLLTLGA